MKPAWGYRQGSLQTQEPSETLPSMCSVKTSSPQQLPKLLSEELCGQISVVSTGSNKGVFHYRTCQSLYYDEAPRE